jgi:cation diffusion facilitator CzcD-associated flavoprotein CzcO
VEEFDVAVIGGGQGGIYSAYRFEQSGLSVVGLDGGSDFGGVWYHNRYPGSRVDTDSLDYCFQFSTDLYSGFRWQERFADGQTLFDYLSYVAEELNVRRFFRFGTRLRDARWSSGDRHWHLQTDQADGIRARFLVMATGVLAAPKPLAFAGLDSFQGEVLETSRWSDPGATFEGLRVGIIGTGASGAQAVPVIAREADHLVVFQRRPHWGIPAQNRPLEPDEQDEVARNLEAERALHLALSGPADPRGGSKRLRATDEPARPVADYADGERRELLERQWEYGGHGMTYLFADETVNPDSNGIVSEFVREKIRRRVADPVLAEKLSPGYPFGTRRLILEIGYYEAFNQDNVTLADGVRDPIVEVTQTGIRTAERHYELDVIIFALGFRSFVGTLDDAGIRSENGYTPKEAWANGPRTLFGLMTPGFPNLFHPTNAGSPSVLGNAMLQHEFFGDWIANCIAYMDDRGFASIEASDAAADEWMHVVDSYAQRMFPIRRLENQYMVHVNGDGSRLFIPFCAGMGEYTPRVNAATENDYAGFILS